MFFQCITYVDFFPSIKYHQIPRQDSILQPICSVNLKVVELAPGIYAHISALFSDQKQKQQKGKKIGFLPDLISGKRMQPCEHVNYQVSRRHSRYNVKVCVGRSRIRKDCFYVDLCRSLKR
jgi:hypothetical protein